MDSIVLDQKLESLRRCIVRIGEKRPADVASLVADVDIQDILVLNLTRAILVCVDVANHIISSSEETAPATMGESFTTLAKLQVLSHDTAAELRKAVGFRNVAVHSYEEINWAIVHAICFKQLPIFCEFVRQADVYIERLGN